MSGETDGEEGSMKKTEAERRLVDLDLLAVAQQEWTIDQRRAYQRLVKFLKGMVRVGW